MNNIRIILILSFVFCTNVLKAKTNPVDLGLSVKWAECNVGAKNPWEAGNYYYWGDPSGEKALEDIFSNEDSIMDITGTARDIAKVNMGGNWRMPTCKELNELVEKCYWQVETLNGVNGFRVKGPNGNSIFIPAVGGYDRGVFRTDQGAGLWSGTFNFEWNRIDFLLVWIKQYGNCDSQIIKVNLRQGSMRYKFNVRAVCK